MQRCVHRGVQHIAIRVGSRDHCTVRGCRDRRFELEVAVGRVGRNRNDRCAVQLESCAVDRSVALVRDRHCPASHHGVGALRQSEGQVARHDYIRRLRGVLLNCEQCVYRSRRRYTVVVRDNKQVWARDQVAGVLEVGIAVFGVHIGQRQAGAGGAQAGSESTTQRVVRSSGDITVDDRPGEDHEYVILTSRDRELAVAAHVEHRAVVRLYVHHHVDRAAARVAGIIHSSNNYRGVGAYQRAAGRAHNRNSRLYITVVYYRIRVVQGHQAIRITAGYFQRDRARSVNLRYAHVGSGDHESLLNGAAWAGGGHRHRVGSDSSVDVQGVRHLCSRVLHQHQRNGGENPQVRVASSSRHGGDTLRVQCKNSPLQVNPTVAFRRREVKWGGRRAAGGVCHRQKPSLCQGLLQAG